MCLVAFDFILKPYMARSRQALFIVSFEATVHQSARLPDFIGLFAVIAPRRVEALFLPALRFAIAANRA